MGGWGFVLLAYGVVWTALALYVVALQRRMRRAAAKLAQAESKGSAVRNAS